MDDSQKAEIRKLWDAWQEAKQRYDHLARTNTVGLTYDALFELDFAYRRAMREMMNAEDAYSAAVRRAS